MLHLSKIKAKRMRGAALCALIFAGALLSSCSGAVESAAQPAVPAASRTQQQIVEEEQEMQYYFDTYNDLYAALILREMFEAGEIAPGTYNGDYAAAGEDLGAYRIHELHKTASVLNCRLSGLSKKSLLKFSLMLTELMKTSPVMISIFSDQAQRDEVENALKVIDSWALSTDHGNTLEMEEMLTSESLSCGARVYLYYYLSYVSNNIDAVEVDDGKYDPSYYIESRIGGWFTEALYDLLLENNKPKENGAAQTYDF